MKRRFQIGLLFALPIITVAVVAVLAWYYSDFEAVRGKYDQINIGMTLAEAEAVIGVPHRSPSWNAQTYPATVEEGPEGDTSALEVTYISVNQYGIALWCNLGTEIVKKKELKRNPDPLTLFFRRFLSPSFKELG